MARIRVEESGKNRLRVARTTWENLAKAVILKARPTLLTDRGGNLSLVWVGDKAMKKLNAKHRGLNETTDVLSFSFIEDDVWPQDDCLGEIIISADTARTQAKSHGHSVTDEARILFVHGLLHILGFDHERPADLRRMLKQEQKHLGDKAGLIERSKGESKMSSRKKTRLP